MSRQAAAIDRARELLDNVYAQEDELERMRRDAPDDHLQLAATGSLGRLSRDRQWTVELATAEALVAIAASLAELVDAADNGLLSR